MATMTEEHRNTIAAAAEPRTAKRLWIGVLLSCTMLVAQQTSPVMDDRRVYELFKAGLTPDELEHLIMTTPHVAFDLTTGTMQNLLAAGVPERIIKVMAARMNGGPTSSDERQAFNPVSVASGLPDDIGIYFQKNGEWVDVVPEIINWQTGGVLKKVATVGIVKGDVNGRLNKKASLTAFSTPIDLYVHCAEGNAITEYQLLRLHEHSDAREFRSVTGGVLHVSGGAKRDTLDFESTRIGKRLYLVKVPALRAGEYGILPPGAFMSTSASAQYGKMYTFSVR